MRILLIDDEPETARLLAKGLREQGYAVDVAADGEQALQAAAVSDYDLLILDVMLPGRDGFAVCRALRSDGCSAPILMLTARDAIADRITGLDAGADDYLPKPFHFEELLARVRALTRRQPLLQQRTLAVGDLLVDTTKREVTRAGRAIELTAKEYALLEYLASRAEEVVTRAEIAEHVWDDSYDPFSNLIEVYVQRLRRKLGDSGDAGLIRTRRGQGYVLRASEEHAGD
jgi:two-component system copper resistance phosphate regulon response regulator CusR